MVKRMDFMLYVKKIPHLHHGRTICMEKIQEAIDCYHDPHLPVCKEYFNVRACN